MSEQADYEDIINFPAPVSRRHIRMSMAARAAQFMPFSALNGYAESIHEAGRVTTERILLSESEKERIDRVLRKIQTELPSPVAVSLTRFLPDSKKDGGRYEEIHARVLRTDVFRRELILDNGETVPFRNILQIIREKNIKSLSNNREVFYTNRP